MKIRIGIIGASGYTGLELARLVALHPKFELTCITAKKYAGVKISELYPSLLGFCDLVLEEYDESVVSEKCDAVLLGLPSGESMKVALKLYENGIPIVDLSADLRFEDANNYEYWYGLKHLCPEISRVAVYGLPELYRNEINDAKVVANPGCYPTAALIALYPALKASLCGSTIIIDAKSGISGAGRQLTLETHFPQAADTISPYKVSGHRHLGEIESEIKKIVKVDNPQIVFVPHLVPMNRGILCTIYVPLRNEINIDEIREIYEGEYKNELFVRLLDKGIYPSTKSVQGSNFAHVSFELSHDRKTLVLMSAIDNLVKGAAGQAIQNLNIMLGIYEGEGLLWPGVFP